MEQTPHSVPQSHSQLMTDQRSDLHLGHQNHGATMKTRHARVFILTCVLMLDFAPKASGSPVGLELEGRRSSVVRDGYTYTYPQAVDNSKQPHTNKNKHLWITHSKQLITLTWASKEIKPFLKIIYRESRWNPNAYNPATNAYGLGQLIDSKHYTKNMPYKQINAAVKYIAHRYGTPTKAYQHHKKHGWY
jgi:hypothetical protein